MKAWIVYHRNDSIKNKRYIEFYKEEGKLRGIDFSLVLIEEVKFGVKHGKRYLEVNGEQVERPDFIVNRSIHPLLVKQFECFNIPVFNNAKVCEICNNKALTYQYVSQLGIPMVDSYFYENEQYEECISKLPDDQYVIKAVAGHGGSQVFLYNQNDKGNISVGLNGADFVSCDEIFNKADVISLNCPLNNHTQEIINAKNISY